MSTANTHTEIADPIELFNTQLAHAKLAALKLLQDLTASLTDPTARVGAALRELRLAATAILRASPMKTDAPADRVTTPPPAPPPHPSSPPTPDAPRLHVPSPQPKLDASLCPASPSSGRRPPLSPSRALSTETPSG